MGLRRLRDSQKDYGPDFVAGAVIKTSGDSIKAVAEREKCDAF
jgi:hypothetical protein